MNVYFNADGKEHALKIKAFTSRPEKIVVQVKDADKPFTYYTNREATVNGEQEFIVRLPQSPKRAVVSLFNKKNGNKPNGKDRTFTADFKREDLKKPLNVYLTKRKEVKSFIKFAQEFSERAGVLSDSLPDGASIYASDDGKFIIKYVKVIRDNNRFIPDRRTGRLVMNPHYGKPLKTPARINRRTGIIEISKDYFKKYTVPMRMAILLHEFSHFYLNDNPSNEIEADLNALTIYLGMGYPRIEAYQAWLEVFKGTDTPQNRERWGEIKKFIDEFENSKYSLIP